MIDKERLEAHLNNGEVELIMCAAIHVDDGIDRMYQPYNIDKGLVFCGWRHWKYITKSILNNEGP